MPTASEHVTASTRDIDADQDFVDALPATTRAVVCGFLSARAVLYSHATDAGVTTDTATAQGVETDATWARERFKAMRMHPAFAHLMPAVRERVEYLIVQAGDALYTLTPRQAANLAAA